MLKYNNVNGPMKFCGRISQLSSVSPFVIIHLKFQSRFYSFLFSKFLLFLRNSCSSSQAKVCFPQRQAVMFLYVGRTFTLIRLLVAGIDRIRCCAEKLITFFSDIRYLRTECDIAVLHSIL